MGFLSLASRHVSLVFLRALLRHQFGSDVGEPDAASLGWKYKLPTWLMLVMEWGHSIFYVVWLDYGSYYLKVFCLSRLPITLSFG